jgi:hypothetical protein
MRNGRKRKKDASEIRKWRKREREREKEREMKDGICV